MFKSPLSLHCSVNGSNNVVWLLLPPAIRMSPFGRYEIPGQNMSACTPASIIGLTTPVVGSKNEIHVLLGSVPMSPPWLSAQTDDHIRIEPVGSITAATGTTGV